MKDTNASFTSKYGITVGACVLALVLCGYALHRINDRQKTFHAAVRTAHQQTANYDEELFNMVVSLEEILAERASFGYAGSRDPMTGVTRAVAVRQPPAATKVAMPRRTAPVAAAPVEAEAPRVMQEVDPVRLTAIIYDNTRRTYTAVVMDGSRSLSVDVGDRVAGRRVVRITNDEIHLETDTERFIYNILGGNTRIQK